MFIFLKSYYVLAETIYYRRDRETERESKKQIETESYREKQRAERVLRGRESVKRQREC